MKLAELGTLSFWNKLASSHLEEVTLVLTVAIVVLADRYLRRFINQHMASRGPVLRFLVFLLVCSVGYAVLALGIAFAVKGGLGVQRGAYMAPIALAVVIVVAIEAQRQKQA